jgi:circadian clock protein KaiC
MTGMAMPRSGRVETGVEGLDDVLNGGLPANRLYLLQGTPGVGKTTVALQFLRTGAARGEAALYVSLSETIDELQAVATAHDWSLEGVSVHEMAGIDPTQEENTLYAPAEVELGERMQQLLAEVRRVRPRRLVIDSCTDLRLLAQTQLRFRRQILALKQELTPFECTSLLIDNPPLAGGDTLLQSLVHGVIEMEQLAPLYGAERRRLRVIKLREVKFRGGYHDYTILARGVVVFPRLIAAEHHQAFTPDRISSGIKALDDLLGGGVDRGTGTLFMGPAGTGKSVVATRYAIAAADRGEKVTMFIFDERTSTLFQRSKALGMGLDEHVAAGRITVQQIDPAEMSPGEFIYIVQRAVDHGASMVVIDSLNGYLQAMPEEQFVLTQLHELLSYLGQKGVATLMVVAQHGLVGTTAAPIDLSYLADTVLLLRYFEIHGRIRKAISVVKKRTGRHEDTIREFVIDAGGLRLGPPLTEFQGVLTGVPTYVGEDGSAGVPEKPGG